MACDLSTLQTRSCKSVREFEDEDVSVLRSVVWCNLDRNSKTERESEKRRELG